MKNLILILIIAAIAGLAAGYVYKAKKQGQKCIGCPHSKNCGTGKSGCSGCCASQHHGIG